VLTDFAIEALKQHKERQLIIKQMAGSLWEDHDYVFCSPTGTYLGPGHNALVQLKKLLEKAGLPNIRFHDLRHSTATLLFGMKVHPKIVQELLGHSEISMTMDIYSHVLPSMQEDVIDKLNRVFKKQDDNKEEGDNGMAGTGVPSKPRK
jgi:integrase